MGENMALDAATIRFLKQLTEGGGKPLHESTPDEARVYLSGLAELAGPAPEMQDAVGSFNGAFWTDPQGVTNVDDVSAAILTFINPAAINATHVSVTDVHPNRPDLGGNSVHPNRLVSIDDVFQFILAFQGDQFPGFALNSCTDP